VSFHRKLALFGEEQEQHTDVEMTERLLRLISKNDARVGYIPEASHPDRASFETKRKYYAGIGLKLAVYFDEETPDNGLESLFGCHAIHLSGGNTFCFLYWLKQRNMIPALRQYVADGGVLIGVSAGSILMTPSVDSAALCGDALDPRLEDHTALGIVNFHFWPHFDPYRELDPTTSKLAASLGELYACPSGGGIIVDEAEIVLFGRVDKYRPACLRT
jgi:dipeptidase E